MLRPTVGRSPKASGGTGPLGLRARYLFNERIPSLHHRVGPHQKDNIQVSTCHTSHHCFVSWPAPAMPNPLWVSSRTQSSRRSSRSPIGPRSTWEGKFNPLECKQLSDRLG